MMKKKFLYSTIAVLMFFPAVSIAAETEENKMKTLDEVVVTATRSAKDIKTVPANVMVITAEEIADSGASSIVEVLENQANLHIRTYSGNPSQAQIDLRGFGENGFGRTLVLLDDRRLNRLDMSSINWASLPLEQIERIEIVKGSGSVLYGDTAVAGVIHIITKKGGIEPSITGMVQAGEDGFHNESAGIIGSSEKISYSVNASNQKTDGWRARTGFQSYGGGIQLGLDMTDYLSISGGFSYNKTEFEMPSALTAFDLILDRTQTWFGYEQDEAENEYHNANLLLEASLGNLGDLEMNFVYGTSESIFTRVSYWSFSVSDMESIGVQPKYILESNHGYFHNQLVTGIDLYHETLTVDKYGEPERINKTHVTELERNTLGWYVRDEISIKENFFISGGARIEKAEISGRSITLPATVDFDDEKEHDGKVFEFGAIWLPNDDVKVYTRYSTVYRYPFTEEQASYYGFGTDTFLSNIEAEEGQSIEAGLKINPHQDLSVGLTLFQIDMEDEISWNDVTMRNENLDDTRHRGLEVFFDYALAGIFDLSMNYTYQEATFTAGSNNGNDIPLVPNHLLSAILDITLPYNLHIIPSLRYVDDSYLSLDFDNNAEKLDNYTVVDLLLRYKSKLGQVKLTAFLGINNLLDEEFSTLGQDWGGGFNVYYPSPDRKFYGGISGTF